MNYRNINIIMGWATFAIALTVYLLTMEPTASFWDCGEFLACAYKLEVGHSPGAPFFMLMQRMFGIIAGGQTDKAAMLINAESAMASAFTILFLFWTITHMARKLVSKNGSEPTGMQTMLIMGCGLVGGLAYTFSDTFWFSAVEAEVYATSSFFTALVVWAILKWENVADRPYADRWLVLIAYLIGISVGVHLLNLLAIPALAMVYYYRRYTATRRGIVVALIIGCVLLAFVQFGIIQYLPIIASKFELLFVNELRLPYDSGAIFFMCLLVASLVWLLLYARKKQQYLLHTGTLCIMFIIIGFSSYIVPVIRSRADTPVDMTNPDNVMSLVGYVQRSQYLQQPLVYGPDYNSQITGMDKTAKVYGRSKTGKNAYEHIDDRVGYKYEEGSKRLFPRIWSHDATHARYYRNNLGLEDNDEPSSADNLSFFFGYQLNWMWWRYFMWNYAGRQNDQQGLGGVKNGNWISGIKPLDKMRVGDIDKMGDGYANNGARNQLYFLPLILGILGMVYQFNHHKKDASITAMLFFFTGIAIALYLNMNPLQPRERDYAFAGSTYAFAIWIGLGVLMVHQWMGRLVQNSSSIIITILLCLLAVPVLMAKEEWHDHDRSKRTLARATAYNTLISCAPNAILFTNGDNDTYPLWYLQEVEGIRKDVRVIITELLGTDWYIDQLNYRVNDADAVPMIWKYDDYKGNRHNYVPFYNSPQIPQDRYYSLAELCAFMNSNEPKNQVQNGGGESMNFLPSKNVFLPRPSLSEIVNNGWVKAADTSNINNGEVKFTLPDEPLYKNDLAMLNIIAAIAREGWERPVYFNGSFPGNSNTMNMGRYMHMEGINYRLLPFTYNGLPEKPGLDTGPIDVEKTFDLIMNKYKWGGADRRDVHFDDKYRVMMISYRLVATRLAEHLIANSRKEDAIKVLDKITRSFNENSYPYDMTACYLASAYYHAGAIERAQKIALKVAKNAEADIAWVNSLKEEQQLTVTGDIQNDLTALNLLSKAAGESGDQKNAQLFNNKLQALYNKMLPVLEAGRRE